MVYPGATETYIYYTTGHLQSLENKTTGGSIIDSYSYTYDPAGNQLSKTDAKGITHYEYDSLNRLTKVTEPNGRVTEYTFDKAGNRKTEKVVDGATTTTTTYEYNSQNRLMSLIKESNVGVKDITKYTYDHNGNMTYQAEETIKLATPGLKPSFGLIIIGQTESEMSRRVAHYTYNAFNQLVSAKTGGTTAHYVYNGEGLRVQKTVNGETTLYLYEYDKVVLELDLNGSVKARNIYGLNLLARQVDGEKYYFMYNGHADVTVLLDAASGLVAASYYYDAFGNILEESGSVNNPIRYAGYQYDEETELYYLNARMYDPKVARFLQEDTYRGNRHDPLSLHLYAYAVNNPIRYWDPTGRTAVSVNINGATIEGKIVDGRTQVALRDIASQIGGTVEWDGKNTAILTLADGTQKFYDTTNTNRVMVNVRDFINEVDSSRTVDYTDTGNGTARVDISGKKDTGDISGQNSSNVTKPSLAHQIWDVVTDFAEGFMQGTTEVVSYRQYVSPAADSFAQHLGQITGIVNTTVLVVTTEFTAGSSATTLGVLASGPTGGASLVVSAGGVAILADAAAHATAGICALWAKVSGNDEGGSSRGRSKGGRHEPSNLKEQLAMEETRTNPEKGIVLEGKNTDPKWPADEGWLKKAQNINGVEVHYQYNPQTGQVDDIKIK